MTCTKLRPVSTPSPRTASFAKTYFWVWKLPEPTTNRIKWSKSLRSRERAQPYALLIVRDPHLIVIYRGLPFTNLTSDRYHGLRDAPRATLTSRPKQISSSITVKVDLNRSDLGWPTKSTQRGSSCLKEGCQQLSQSWTNNFNRIITYRWISMTECVMCESNIIWLTKI